MDSGPTVFVVDDDIDVRKSIIWLLDSINKPVKVFATANEFLEFYTPDQQGCLISDVRLPDVSGIQLQERLLQRGCQIPIIFITAHIDVPIAIRAIKAGAMDFLVKPFNDQKLLDLVNKALSEDERRRGTQQEYQLLQAKVGRLTPREFEVVQHVLAGKINKVIAQEMHISCKTVELHRGNAMKKLQARTVVDLVNLFHRYRSAQATEAVAQV
ncbi:MAG: response regulator [Gammaproteobacteria bacterium]|nr:response regulator [Gammaproteobacteria bacterium]